MKLTGEAFDEHRRALMASVSSAGNSVEPQSLACAVDVTPGEVGGGPLASTVLIEQIKRAGALTEVTDSACMDHHFCFLFCTCISFHFLLCSKFCSHRLESVLLYAQQLPITVVDRTGIVEHESTARYGSLLPVLALL